MLRLAVLALAVSLFACADNGSTGLTQADIVCPTDSNLTYANFGSLTISDNCLACHNTTNPRLTTQAQVLQAKGSIISAAVLGTRMPRGGGMSTEERKMLGQWLNCGAP
jgi:uncharacterized membrane protein